MLPTRGTERRMDRYDHRSMRTQGIVSTSVRPQQCHQTRPHISRQTSHQMRSSKPQRHGHPCRQQHSTHSNSFPDSSSGQTSILNFLHSASDVWRDGSNGASYHRSHRIYIYSPSTSLSWTASPFLESAL
jgi:hypothetical protein